MIVFPAIVYYWTQIILIFLPQPLSPLASRGPRSSLSASHVSHSGLAFSNLKVLSSPYRVSISARVMASSKCVSVQERSSTDADFGEAIALALM